MVMIGRYWEDFKVGEEFETARRTISESDLLQFCNLTWFNMSLFFDEVYAREETIYGARVVPGPFIIPLAVGLFLKLGFYERTALSLLDIRNMRFHNSLHVGETMQVKVTILEKRETKKSDRGLLIPQFEVSKHDGTPIMSFEMLHLLKRK
jgi:3-hydroxybutyryl-CoA dehydratase